MNTPVKQGGTFDPSVLTDDEMFEGLDQLEAYQAQFAPPASQPDTQYQRREIAEYIPQVFEDEEPRRFSWKWGAVVFGLSFAGVLWVFKGGPAAPGAAGLSTAGVAPEIAGQAGGGGFSALSAGTGAPFPVSVRTSQAIRRDQVLTVRGRTEAAARVEVKAETAGVVESIGAPKGTRVQKGDVLCQMAPGARQAALAEARAQLVKARLDIEGNSPRADKGPAGKPSPAALKAALDVAEASVRKAEIELARTRIGAPFAGVVEEQPARAGEFLAVGSTCAVVIAPDPLYIVGSVAERDVGRLANGMKGTAQLMTGETVAGGIAFISSSAEPSTRTFRVELRVANAEGKLRDGVTATMRIPMRGEPAHKLSPSTLTLNDAGQLGVRVVERGETARFMPVKVLSDERDNVWVGGLPVEVKVIVAGQEFVIDGQRVEIAEKRDAARQ